jgi:hypothetical protein
VKICKRKMIKIAAKIVAATNSEMREIADDSFDSI